MKEGIKSHTGGLWNGERGAQEGGFLKVNKAERIIHSKATKGSVLLIF